MSAPQTPEETPVKFSLMRLLVRVCIILCLCAGVVALIGHQWLKIISTQEGPHQEHAIILVKPGDGHMVLKHKLERENLIHSHLHYHLYALYHHDTYIPKAGEYKVEAGASLEAIFKSLDSGKTYQRRLTIVEGQRSFDVMNSLNDAEGLSSVILSSPLEGSIFPDTYFYSYGDDRRQLLARMQQKMEITKAEIWAERDTTIPLKNADELVILASIIEKEAGNNAERALISSVFMNRLKKRMRLQSDPTVAYGLSLEKPLQLRLSKADLKTSHRWNSYLNAGLPPTPIANPSYESLYAAAHPAESDYFYFVADAEGGHAFSRTLAEHNKNVRIYRQKIKKRKTQN